MATEQVTLRLGATIQELPKSSLPAGASDPLGTVPFYCSSPIPSRIDRAIMDGEAVMMGTGGEATVHYDHGEFSFSTDTWAFRSSSPLLRTKFLWRWIQRNLDWVDYTCFQGTGLKHLQKADIRAATLDLPSVEDQDRSLNLLDAIDDAVDQADALIQKLLRVRSGVMTDLLRCGIGEGGLIGPRATRPSDIGPVPRDWDVLPLARAAAVDRGKFTHRPRNDPAFYDGPFPFIQTGDVTSAAGGRIYEATQSLNDRGAAVSKEFPAETIAVTIAANIGETAILGIPMHFPDSVVGVVVQPPHSVRWIEMCLQRAQHRLDALAPQSAQKNINLEALRPLLVPIPPAPEQHRAAEIYEDLSAQIVLERQSREKLVYLRDALLDDLVARVANATAGFVA